jgi:dolichol-phosphate mannosyltransferase
LLSLIIPTYNERENVGELIGRIESLRAKLPYELSIVVVDDNSADGTAEVVKDLMRKYENVKLIQRPRPAGLGSAYMDGFRYALETLKADYVGEMDADLQHPPEILPVMCEAVRSGSDVVLASRYIEGGSSQGLSFRRKVVSKGANLLTAIFLRVPVKDATTGFRIISAKAVAALLEFELSATGYAFQVQSLYVYQKVGMRFSEVPFSFETRKSGQTKLHRKEIWSFAKITIKTGILGIRKRTLSPGETNSIPITS